ncbi:unnamed protein product [Heligmosomoides polygyrus]|uniref:DUF2075 domain-containing protein n=1 Tax=Heligmosomoides polygyrus TaxID=6339 RepID=A0A183GDG8_HELPZ|nr:unnamed protein product [Heligmosomoides polygyrus]
MSLSAIRRHSPLSGHSASFGPLRQPRQLDDMTSEAGWACHRPIGVWIMVFIRPDVSGSYGASDRGAPAPGSANLLIVRRVPLSGSYASGPYRQQLGLPGAMRETERVPIQRNPGIRGCLRDATVHECADGQFRKENTGCGVWNYTLIVCRREPAEHRASHPRRGRITHIYQQAVTNSDGGPAAGPCDRYNTIPVVTEVAFGTGKTVVGAWIAARQARGGARTIVTATTNAAHITETILSLDAFTDLAVCRYITESVVFDDSIAATPANMHEILKQLPDLYKDELEEEALDECERFRDGRIVFEACMQNSERQEFLTEQEREGLVLAERDVYDLIGKIVEIMFLK